MATANTITAEMRERAGKGAARATRRAGRIPAVIYGKETTPIMISLDPIELTHHLKRAGFFAHVVEVDLKGQKYRVLPRDVQFHPVSDRPIHVDFLKFSADTKLRVDIEVNFINGDKSPGLKNGGVLNIVRHTVEVFCSPDAIPENFTVNLEGLNIGDSIHISHVQMPEGAKPTIGDRDFTIATIAAPSTMPSEEEEKAAAAAAAPAEGAAAADAGKDDKKGGDAKAPAAKPAAKK